MSLIGQILQDRYKVIRQIGEGGMGRVYFGEDIRLNQEVAIKETIKLDSDEPSQYITARIRAFQKEAELLAGKIKHPAIPKVIDYFQSEGNWYIVMEYIDGNSLEVQQFERAAAFGADEVLQWIDQLLRILDSLHSQHPKIIHRDIKPSNIKVKNNRVYLLDFGLAKQLTGSKSTIASFVTPAYASPEHMSNKEPTEKSDLYSVGATMYCLLTNKEPVSVTERSVDLAAKKPDPLKNIKELCPGLNDEVAKIIMSAMSINADQRPAGAEVMRLALERAVSMKDAINTQAQTVPLPLISRNEATTRRLPRNGRSRKSGKTWKVWAGAAAIVLIAAAALGFILLRPPVQQDVIAKTNSPREIATELTTQATNKIYTNNYDEAKELSKQAIAADSSYAIAYAINGDAFWDTDQEEEDAKSNSRSQINKAEILKIFETREPSNEEEYAARAWAFLIDQKWERAKQDIEKVIKTRPEWAWALGVQASILTNGNCIKEQKSKESDAVIEILKKINGLQPNYANGYRLLGVQYSCIDKTEDAISAFAKAINYWPSAYNYTQIGTLYLNLSDKITNKAKLKESFESAKQNFIKANEADPNFYNAYIGLARMHHSKAEYKECVAEAEKALSRKDFAAGNYWWSLCRLSMANKAKDEPGFLEAAEKSAKSIDLLKRSDLGNKENLLAEYYYNDGAIHYNKAIYTYNVKFKKNQKAGKESTRKELEVAQNSIDSAISLDANNKNYQKAKEAIRKSMRVVK